MPWLVAGGVGIALIGFSLFYKFWWPNAGATLSELPDPALEALEPQVAQKIAAYRLRVKESSGSDLAWGKLGMVLDVHELTQEAMTCYRQAARINAGEFRWAYYGGIILSALGSPDAVEWLEKSRQLHAGYAPLEVLYGHTLFDLGRIEEASATFARALALDPKLPQALHGLARVALARSDYLGSKAYLLRTLQHNPNYREAHGLLSDVYRRLEQPELAERQLRYSQQLPQTTAMPDPIYSELAAEGVSSWWHRRRGQAYMHAGRYELAEKEYRIRLEIKKDAQGHNNLGLALLRLGQKENAIEQFQAALILEPSHADARNNLAGVLFEQGQHSQAIDMIQEVIKSNPNFADAYLNLGAFHMLSGRPAEALRIFNDGQRQIPAHVQLASRLAWILATSKHESLREPIRAVEIAQQTCETTNFLLPDPLDALAAAHAALGQFDQAVNIAEKAIQRTRAGQKRSLIERQARLSLYKSGKMYRE